MAARHSPAAGGARAAAVILGVVAAGVAGAGLAGFFALQRTHLTDEIAYSVSPLTFRAWLAARDPAATAPELVAERLLLLTLPQRRDLVLVMSGRRFWTDLAAEPARRRAFEQLTLEGARTALARAPMLADLWFLAGRLHSRLGGLDPTAQRYLALSATYAPYDLDLALARLEVTAVAWALLDEPLRAAVRRDFHVVATAFPQRTGDLRGQLERAGARLDD